MKIKKEIIKIKPKVKDYKRISREMFLGADLRPKIHRNKKKFNKADRKNWKKDLDYY